MCYYFYDLIKIKDFDPDNILRDEKSYEKLLVYNIFYMSLINFKSLCIRLDKRNRLFEFMVKL